MCIPSSTQVRPLVRRHRHHRHHNSLRPNISGPPTRSTSDHLRRRPRGLRRLNSQPSSRNDEYHHYILIPFVFHILFSVFCHVSLIRPDVILLVVAVYRAVLSLHVLYLLILFILLIILFCISELCNIVSDRFLSDRFIVIYSSNTVVVNIGKI